MSKEKSSGFFKMPFKLPGFHSEDKTVPEPKSVPRRLKMLFFIVDWNKSQVISRVFDEEKVRFHFVTKGRGTASSEILDLLGIGAGDKAVIVCVEQGILAPVLLKEVRKKLGFYKPGAGIAFTVPLSGINTPLLRVFKDSIRKNEKIAVEREGDAMTGEEKTASPVEIHNDLIIAVINQGYSDDFMAAAREAGATGGTVISARALAHEGPVKIFGVSVQAEKEIVLILTGRDKKTQIMEAVSRSCGITSKAEGLVFSLPVDSIMGLHLE